MANNKLNEKMSTSEIVCYFEEKYEPCEISSKTIKRWIHALEIKHITDPPPKRNADIRYKKEDVLKLENKNLKKLQKRQNVVLFEDWKQKEAEKQFERFVEYQDQQANDALKELDYGEYLEYIYEEKAKEIIFMEKVEMCFEYLFSNIEFDEKELATKLFIINEDPFHVDAIEAREYIKRKLYKK